MHASVGYPETNYRLVVVGVVTKNIFEHPISPPVTSVVYLSDI